MLSRTDSSEQSQLLQASLAKLAETTENNSEKYENFEQRLNAIKEAIKTYELEYNNCAQKLINNNQSQLFSIQALNSVANFFAADEKKVDFSEVLQELQNIFLNSVNCLLENSKQSMAMVYSLDNALQELNLVEKIIHQIEQINNKTKYLSLNATIEAARAENNSSSLKALVSEVKELANETHSLTMNMRHQFSSMSNALKETQEIVKSFSQVDINKHIMAKEYIDNVVKNLLENNQQLLEIITNSQNVNQEFSQISTKLIQNSSLHSNIKHDLEALITEMINVNASLSNSNNHHFKNLETQGNAP
jgi:methyl-accepting chemotaxis protein